MGKIGCLGDIPFEVSSDRIRTPSKIKQSGSARYSTHQRHCGDALTEFVGNDPAKITMNIQLSAYMGVDPMACMDKIVKYCREGTVIPLVIGERSYGRYRWTIQSHTAELSQTDGKGNVLSMEVSITLQEYLRT